MFWKKILQQIKTQSGNRIPEGHLYFGEALYAPDIGIKTSDETKNSPFGIRMYIDQNYDTPNGRRVHGVNIYAFPDGTYNLSLLPEHKTKVLLEILCSKGYEVREAGRLGTIPVRAALAKHEQSSRDTNLDVEAKEVLIEAYSEGKNILKVVNERVDDSRRDTNPLAVGKEFMNKEEFKAVIESLSSQGFISPKIMNILPLFHDAAAEYRAGTMNESAVRDRLHRQYSPQQISRS